jgi:hypothetical protein
MRFRFFILIMLFTGCSTKNQVGLSELYQRAHGKIQEKKIGDAIKILRHCARKGHGGCAEILGWSYYYGEGVPQSLKMTERWLLVAAETGTNYGYAGLSGSLSIAEFYCEDSFFRKSEQDIKYWAGETSRLMEEIKEKTGVDQRFEGMNQELERRLIYLNDKIRDKSCESLL